MFSARKIRQRSTTSINEESHNCKRLIGIRQLTHVSYNGDRDVTRNSPRWSNYFNSSSKRHNKQATKVRQHTLQKLVHAHARSTTFRAQKMLAATHSTQFTPCFIDSAIQVLGHPTHKTLLTRSLTSSNTLRSSQRFIWFLVTQCGKPWSSTIGHCRTLICFTGRHLISYFTTLIFFCYIHMLT